MEKGSRYAFHGSVILVKNHASLNLAALIDFSSNETLDPYLDPKSDLIKIKLINIISSVYIVHCRLLPNN